MLKLIILFIKILQCDSLWELCNCINQVAQETTVRAIPSSSPGDSVYSQGQHSQTPSDAHESGGY